MRSNWSRGNIAVCLFPWILCLGLAFGDWDYTYQDDFSTDKIKTDSYSHSILWPEEAFPPVEPYLTFTRFAHEPPALVFWGYQGVPSHVNYVFPPAPSPHPRRLKGTLEFDVLVQPFLAMPKPIGYLSYSLSDDGQVWTVPTIIEKGHHTIAISSSQGTCFVAFLGTFGVLDNLQVELESESTILQVPKDFPAIQDAIDFAQPGDEVEVAPGTYWGQGNWNIDLRGKAISVRGGKGSEETIIDCQGPGQGPGNLPNRGFYIHQGEGPQTLIQGFTIQNGYIPGFSNLYDTQPFTPGAANTVGGGIYCENSGPTITQCIIRNCAAELGGGIGCVNAAPTITDCRITGCKSGGLNNAKSGGFGGGIAILRRSDATIRHCRIIGNHGYFNGYGAGLYVRASSARIENCEIQNNDAEGGLRGGGITIGGPYSKVDLLHCILASNFAYNGGGVFVDGRHDNQTGGLTGPPCEVQIANCTVVDNQLVNPPSQNPAGGIHSSKADIRVRNCIVWKNAGPEMLLTDPASNSPVSYSDIEGGFLGAGNIAVDPLFASSSDYHLQSAIGRYNPATGTWVIDPKHSPCIDAGDPRDDFNEEPTPNGHRINIGAYGNTTEASKGKGHVIYHIDGSTGSDSNSGLNRENAFKTIMKGISVSQSGDTVLVWPGIYIGPINLYGKAITLTSAADPAILQAPDDYAVSMHSGEGPQSVLRNFVIRSSLGGVFVVGGTPTLSHLTIVQNKHGIMAYEGANPDITNSIFWFNSGVDLFGCKARFSCIEDLTSPEENDGNIHQDPIFADPQKGDFHLRSQRGRFLPQPGTGGLWVLDEVTSPCIDAGDPWVRPVRERMPNGGRVNLGADGGTPFASMSDWVLFHDMNRDGVVGMADFADLAEQWLRNLPWAGPLPSLRITKPDTDGTISLGAGRFDITAEVSEPIDEIVRVEFYVDGILVCIDLNGSTGWTCNTFFRTIGVHQVCARAIDRMGRILEADCIELRVVE